MDHLLSRSLVGRTTSEYLTPEFLLGDSLKQPGSLSCHISEDNK